MVVNFFTVLMKHITQKNLKNTEFYLTSNKNFTDHKLIRNASHLPVSNSLKIEPIRFNQEIDDFDDIRSLLAIISPKDLGKNTHKQRSTKLIYSSKSPKIIETEFRLSLKEKKNTPRVLKQEKKKEFKIRKGLNVKARNLFL